MRNSSCSVVFLFFFLNIHSGVLYLGEVYRYLLLLYVQFAAKEVCFII